MNKDIKRLPVERKGIKTTDISRDMKMDIFFSKHYGEKENVPRKIKFSSSNTYGKNNFEDYLEEFFQDPRKFIYKYSRSVKIFN